MKIRSLFLAFASGAIIAQGAIAGIAEDLASGESPAGSVQSVIGSGDYLPGAVLDAAIVDPATCDAVVRAAIDARPDMSSEIAAALATTYSNNSLSPAPNPDCLRSSMEVIAELGDDHLQDAAIAAASSNSYAAGPAVAMVGELGSRELAEEVAGIIARVAPAAQAPMVAFLRTNAPALAESVESSNILAQGAAEVLRGGAQGGVLQTSNEIQPGATLPQRPPSPF